MKGFEQFPSNETNPHELPEGAVEVVSPKLATFRKYIERLNLPGMNIEDLTEEDREMHEKFEELVASNPSQESIQEFLDDIGDGVYIAKMAGGGREVFIVDLVRKAMTLKKETK